MINLKTDIASLSQQLNNQNKQIKNILSYFSDEYQDTRMKSNLEHENRLHKFLETLKIAKQHTQTSSMHEQSYNYSDGLLSPRYTTLKKQYKKKKNHNKQNILIKNVSRISSIKSSIIKNSEKVPNFYKDIAKNSKAETSKNKLIRNNNKKAQNRSFKSFIENNNKKYQPKKAQSSLKLSSKSRNSSYRSIKCPIQQNQGQINLAIKLKVNPKSHTKRYNLKL